MKDQIFSLISEQTSPLFRIMSVYNYDEPLRRNFDNNITAFHIGNGYVLSVAHNLRLEAQPIKSVSEQDYQHLIFARCDEKERALLNRCFLFDGTSNKRYLNTADQNDVQQLIEVFKRINYDTRWITLYAREICKPFLIVQFENNSFYNNDYLDGLFDKSLVFPEPVIGAYTFLIELELVQAFFSEDFALYRMKNTDQKIISSMPAAAISYETFLPNNLLYCLQSSPSGTNLGRMMNEAHIDGILNHHGVDPDRFEGNHIRKGLRYLLKGYFRFGSSGAPYFIFDKESNSFLVNAIQSEASPIQLSIKNDMNGNFQYINAIASPVSIIEEELRKLMMA